jgi:TolB-like protein
MADIFVSYASEDRDRIRPLVEEFQRHGWSVWWDRALHAGPRFDDEIEKALDAARCVVVVWSVHSVRSDWVRNEASEGLSRGILVPAVIDAVGLPLAFRHNQTAQLLHWPASTGDLDVLLTGVEVVLSGSVVKSVSVSQSAKRTPRTNQKAWLIGAAIAVAAATSLFVFRTPHSRSESNGAVPPTAVFAFTVPNGDAGAAELAGAIENEVVETMNAIGLPVIARSGIESLSGSERAARSVQLGAEYALAGDIRRDGENLLVSARIESLGSSTTLWANSYRGADANALRMQIATQLTDTLRCASSESTSPGIGHFPVRRDDVDSLEMLLRACSNVRTSRDDENHEALRTLVQRYPDSATLNAALAYAIIVSLGNAPPTAHAALISEARATAELAMSLDPHGPDAHLALYLVRVAEGATATELEALLVEGLAYAPEHATLNKQYGEFLQRTGRMADAEAYLRRGLVRDPLSAAGPVMLALNLDSLGQRSESEKVLRDAAARWPDDRFVWQTRLYLAVFSDVGDLDTLIASPPTSVPALEAASCWRALRAARSESDADAKRRLASDATAQCLDHRLIDKYEAIGIAASLGIVDDAFARTEHIGSWREFTWLTWPRIPLFGSEARAMQRDARFMPLMRRLGLLDIWVQSDHWPDFCRLPDLPYDCKINLRE